MILNPVFWFWNSKFFAKVFFVRKSLFCQCNCGFWNWNWGSLQQKTFFFSFFFLTQHSELHWRIPVWRTGVFPSFLMEEIVRCCWYHYNRFYGRVFFCILSFFFRRVSKTCLQTTTKCIIVVALPTTPGLKLCWVSKSCCCKRY
jgi:hypothetical protein